VNGDILLIIEASVLAILGLLVLGCFALDRSGMKTTTVSRKSKPKTLQSPKPDNSEQYDRFRKAARELETDESEEAFDRAFKATVKPQPKH
jgi:hypothetical protein